MNLEWLQFSVLDWVACFVFLCSWIGYTRYAIHKSRTTPTLSSVLHSHREQWMLNAVSVVRAETARDIISVGIFERSVAFFASTTILILAGLLTVLGSSEKVASVLASLHFVSDAVAEQIQLKIVLIILLFVHAFFKFCWSMRCYGFLATMLGAVPTEFLKVADGEQNLTTEMQAWSKRAAAIMTSAAHHFNLGLRAYYFALAVLAWFVHPLLFILANITVVAVLYRRDFKSYVLENLQEPTIDTSAKTTTKTMTPKSDDSDD